ncbi:hypothetical protein EGW08_010356 [Elysia chlorotica]|uniref:Nose resistant-to-fluoxetine protein N-terminal domain-containing protein n=1 Tax=Elysia chlorotica TaxID=188477 RepID=A0A3S1C3F6_ELYCH|nr:hypothetical protein EGW08_010356 [Elysia chlorotica]
MSVLLQSVKVALPTIGILVGYVFIQVVENETKIKYVVYVLHRFMRLSPALIVFAAIYICLWPQLGTGPNYPSRAPDEDMCRENWAYTLFYINNFLPMDKLCLMWTWYLSCDYQFYLVCPLFMVPLCLGYRKIGVFLACSFAVGTMITSGVISYENNMAEIVPQFISDGGKISDPRVYYNYFYQRPYCRMGPYIVGLMLGYFFNQTGLQIKISRGPSLKTIETSYRTLHLVNNRFRANDILGAHSNIIEKLGQSIKSGVKPEAAILGAALPMVKELLHIPDGRPGSSLLSVERVLHQSQCARDFERSVAAMLAKKRWAQKLFDSWGKPPPGILKIYANFRGEYKECREIRAPPISVDVDHLLKVSPNIGMATLENLAEEQRHSGRSVSGSDNPEFVKPENGLTEFPEFRGKFCHVGVTVKGVHIAGGKPYVSNPPVVVGLTMDWCVPSSCSESEITDLWNHTFAQLTHDKVDGVPLAPIPATCQEDLPRMEGKTVGILIFITLCLLGQGACTFYDVYYIQRPKWRLQRLKSKFIEKRNDLLTHTRTVQTNGQAEQRAPLIARENHDPYPESGDENLSPEDVPLYEPELSTSLQAVQVFSLYTNGQRLLNTKLAPHTLTCVHGIRAISMAWIVMGHSVLYSMPVAGLIF